MNNENEFPKLYHFLGAYFHQDYYDDGETSDEIVNAYIKGTDNFTKRKLITEITEFLRLYRNELEKTYCSNFTNNNILFEAGADCMPMPDDMSAYDWLMMIKKRLIKVIGSKV